MFIRLILLFTLVPMVELALLIELGKRIGVWETLAIVLLTGVLGATLARTQGFVLIQRIRLELSRGQIPGDSLLDGFLILAGALLLLTPGLLTDAVGFSMLLPVTRTLFRNYLKKFLKRKFQTGESEIHVNYHIDDV